MKHDVLSPGFWADIWRESAARSVLRETQRNAPERWERFYESVAGSWEAVTGGGFAAAEAIADTIAGIQGFPAAGSSVVETGCGEGALSISLARKGYRVTAVDDSEAMIGELSKRLGEYGIPDVAPKAVSWFDSKLPPNGHDVAIAAFFPPAWEPEGIERLSELAEKRILVIPSGPGAIPIRNTLWDAIMDSAPPARSVLIPYLFNYLHHTYDTPLILPVSWHAAVDTSVDVALEFYRCYFAIFEKGGSEVDSAISRILQGFADGDRIRSAGKATAILVCW